MSPLWTLRMNGIKPTPSPSQQALWDCDPTSPITWALPAAISQLLLSFSGPAAI